MEPADKIQKSGPRVSRTRVGDEDLV